MKSKIILGILISLSIILVLLLTKKRGYSEAVDYEEGHGTGLRALFSIYVETDGNGEAFSSHALTVKGDYISLEAEAYEGCEFKEWLVENDAVTIEDNSFIMPGHEVRIKAIFEKIDEAN